MNGIFVQFHFVLCIYILIEFFLYLSGFYHSVFNFLSFFFRVLKYYLAIRLYNLDIHSLHTYLMYTVFFNVFLVIFLILVYFTNRARSVINLVILF